MSEVGSTIIFIHIQGLVVLLSRATLWSGEGRKELYGNEVGTRYLRDKRRTKAKPKISKSQVELFPGIHTSL